MLTRLLQGVAIGSGVLGLPSTGAAQADHWDCHATADGNWACARGGVPETGPTPPTEPVEVKPAPVRTASPAAPVPAPAPSPVAPAAAVPAAVSPAAVAPVQAATVPPTVAVDTPQPAAIAVPGPDSPVSAPTYEVDNRIAPAIADEKAELNGMRSATAEPGSEAPHSGAARMSEAPLAQAGLAGGSNYAALDQGIGWNRCAPALIPVALKGQDALPVTVLADSAEASDIDLQVSFSGDVEISQGEQRIRSREAHYDHASGDLTASGDALLVRPDLRLAAGEVRYNLQSGKGEAMQAEYRLPAILARGTAERAELIDSSISHFKGIDYTTCPPGNSAWKLGAGALELDRAEGLGTATDAKLYFADVPVMYLPVLTFPIDDRRRSGLLIPSIGYGDLHGFDLKLPYYFNLAPNYDLTLAPRLMSKRGAMLDGEFRFLTGHHSGELRGSYIPKDKLAPGDSDQRGGISLKTRSRHTAQLSSSLNINYVSDDDFLEDFGPDIETYGNSNLERSAELNYQERIWSASAKVQHFQTVDPAISTADRPYSVLPRLRLQASDRLDLAMPSRYSFGAEFASFVKDGDVVEGRRLDLYPRINFPVRESWYHLEPAAGLRMTRYELDNQTAGLDASPERVAPVLSLDTGLYFDRDTNWFGKAATQSLEPRAYFLYVPEQDQDDIPIFDTSAYGLSFDNLFRDNRFAGGDRVGDAQQVTLALTSSLDDVQSGEQILRARVGQILYFSDREVQLPGVAVETDQTSPLVGELDAALGANWRGRGELVWDPHSNDIEQALARASYRSSSDHIFSASYRLRETVYTETDLAGIWPINERTRAIARWNYSLSEERNLDALAGIEYGRCCWKLRALVRQQVTGTSNGQNLSFLVQLELRGLGKLGDDIDSILRDGIYGYRRNDD